MQTTEIEDQPKLIQAIEFLDWLRVHNPTLRIPGSISSKRLKKLVLEFCREEGYSNGKMLSKEVNRWLIGKGPAQIIDQIAEHLKFNNQLRLSSNRLNRHNPFDRYFAVSFHALFFFRASDHLRSSMEEDHWSDLHELTGDYLDLYFTKTDLKERTTGYKVINGLKKLELSVDILPALLLWEDHIEVNTIIPLEGLDPDSVIRVMEEIVRAIKEGCDLKVIAEKGEYRSRELKREILSREGGINMSKIEIYGDTIGCNIGSSGNIIGSIAIKGKKEEKLEKALTTEEIAIIKNISDTLKDKEIEGIKFSERMEGVFYLAELADAKNKDHQEEKLAKWKKWLNSLAERSQKVISFLADTVTITIPIGTLLGIYPA